MQETSNMMLLVSIVGLRGKYGSWIGGKGE